LALAASASGAGRLANSNKHRVGRNGGGFQRRLELEIGDLLSRPLSTATSPPCARPFMLERPIQEHTRMVYMRANSSLRARYTRAPVVASDLLSRPLYLATRRPCARPLMLRRLIQAHKYMFAREPVHAYAAITRAHPLLLARDPVQACARLTRAPAVRCSPPTPPCPLRLRAS
jgi:hypothetical protein